MTEGAERPLTDRGAHLVHLVVTRLPPEKWETYVEMLEIVAALFNGERDVEGAINRIVPLAGDVFGPMAADYVSTLREQLRRREGAS